MPTLWPNYFIPQYLPKRMKTYIPKKTHIRIYIITSLIKVKNWKYPISHQQENGQATFGMQLNNKKRMYYQNKEQSQKNYVYQKKL